MAEISENAALGALEAAFGDAPPPKPAKAPVAPPKPVAEAPEPVPAEDAETDAVEAQDDAGEPAADDEADEPAEVVEAEPEYEVEVAGRKEIVKGKEQVKELLQKGLDYTRKAEANARNSEIIAAQARSLELQQQAQAALYEDVTTLRALDSQLEQYNKIDWAAAFDSDPFNAMKLKEQRDQLREARAAKSAELNHKHAAIQQGQAQAAQAALRAENEALLNKLPQWRNSEQAQKEKQSLARYLMDSGFGEGEVSSLMDHRALLITRKAWLYDQLQASKDGKVKQLRDAPTMAKPGAAPQQQKANQKESFAKFRQELKARGKQGNSRAQEELMLGVLGRTFK
jgi:hypothetical protein